MAWDKKLSSRTFQKAGTELRRRYKQEYIDYVREFGSESKAQAQLQRKHHKEFRLIFNDVAQQTGHKTHEMRRARLIERLENQLNQLREDA